jgi:predicted TIM-barrel fold metal-dependent hydrolase
MGSHSDEAAGNSALEPSSALIDVHAHYVPPEWHAMPAAAAPLFRGFSSWSIPSALEMMDRQGIAVAVLSMVFWSGLFGDAGDVAAARRLARSSNEGAAEAIRGRPGRFGGFACLPLPDVDGALAEIDYGHGTLGLDGVALAGNPAPEGRRPGDDPAAQRPAAVPAAGAGSRSGRLISQPR